MHSGEKHGRDLLKGESQSNVSALTIVTILVVLQLHLKGLLRNTTPLFVNYQDYEEVPEMS